MEQLILSSVENLPNARASAAFTEPKPVFKEDGEITPTILSDTHAYMPWGATQPYALRHHRPDRIGRNPCHLSDVPAPKYAMAPPPIRHTAQAADTVAADVEDFLLDNDLASYFLGVCQDFKHFAFAVSVIILNTEGHKDSAPYPERACYCRFAPADTHGKIPRLYFANWRKFATLGDCEIIEMLDAAAPLCDLRERLKTATAAANSLSSAAFPRPTAHIILSHIMPRSFAASGSTSSSLSASPKRSSATPRLSNTTSKCRRNTGIPYSNPRASPTAPGNRRASSRKSGAYSTSSPARRTPARYGSAPSTSTPTATCSTTS